MIPSNLKFCAGALITLMLCAVGCLSAQAQTVMGGWKFTLVLPITPKPLPGGQGIFPKTPVLSESSENTDQTLFFAGYQFGHPLDPTGIYRMDGAKLTTLADTHTRIPGRRRKFGIFQETVMTCSNRVAFMGASKSGEIEWLYLFQDGNLSIVADNRTILPESKEKLTRVHLPLNQNSFNANHLLFYANGEETYGIYSREKDGKLIRIVDNTMTVPGTNTRFRNFGEVKLCGDLVCFTSNNNDDTRGVYLYERSKITGVANRKTPVPNTNSTFSNASQIALSDKRLCMVGQYQVGESFQYGLYEKTAKGIVSLLDLKTLLPHDAKYVYMPNCLIAWDDTLLFAVSRLYGNGVSGNSLGSPERLFVNRNGTTKEILKVGDTIDGKIVEGFYPEQVTAGRFLLTLFFTDKTCGYYGAQAVSDTKTSAKRSETTTEITRQEIK